MTLQTCTKVNIGLNILRKRPDGYHDLETLFVPYYGYSDALSVEPSERLSVGISPCDWDPMEDLTVRAWRLLKADFPDLPAVSIHLQKGAPVGAGLGGGSADAAFMLKAMNELGGLGLDDARLQEYAAKLGSDCAFFIHCRPMFATGRGEILEPYDIDLSGYRLQVELPMDSETGKPVAVSTKEAYAGISPRGTSCLGRDDRAVISTENGDGSSGMSTKNGNDGSVISTGAKRSGEISLREALRRPVEEWRGVVVNDFERSVCAAHPEISALIDSFYDRGAAYAAMSGSGSAVFGLFPL